MTVPSVEKLNDCVQTASSVPPSEHDNMMNALNTLDMGIGGDEYFDRSLASPSSE